MADNRLLLEAPAQATTAQPAAVELPSGAKIPGVKEGALNAVAQWIPIETIGVYVFLQTLFLDPLNPPPGKHLYDMNFTARWEVFAVGFVITLLSVPLYTAVKAKNSATANFKFPLGETIIGAVAFVLWAMALPDTPANDWKWWNPDYGVAAIAVSAIFLNPIATLLGIKAQWGKTDPEPTETPEPPAP
jgi:hypothetical protein